MCWKKIFGGGGGEVMNPAEFRFLTFGKNKYGGGNDLNGCINDCYNLSNKFKTLWPAIETNIFTDSQVTANNYKSKVVEAKKLAGADVNVLVLMDSCFSGTATRLYPMNPGRIKNRFFDPGLPKVEKVKSKIWRSADITWGAISAGREDQTVADAYFKQYEGAWSHFAYLVLEKEMTPREWFTQIRRYLPSTQFDQEPTIEGPTSVLDKKMGDGVWLIIHNSSHGSWTVDRSGDEHDQRDEGLYFDRLLIDDEINEFLRA